MSEVATVNARVSLTIAANILDREAERLKDSCRVRGLEWACCDPNGHSPCEARNEYAEMRRLAGELRELVKAKS